MILVNQIGTDDWGRKIYQSAKGIRYVDVDGEIHTMTPQGEPEMPCSDIAIADKASGVVLDILNELKDATLRLNRLWFVQSNYNGFVAEAQSIRDFLQAYLKDLEACTRPFDS